MNRTVGIRDARQAAQPVPDIRRQDNILLGPDNGRGIDLDSIGRIRLLKSPIFLLFQNLLKR